jgi:D-alanine-D-alanine ligase
MQVAILFSERKQLEHGEAVDAVAVQAVLDEVGAVEGACLELGWEPRRVLFADREGIDADVVFNLVEGAEEPAAAWFLEDAGVPFTGSPGDALALACDKPAARAVLLAAGVPIPRGCVLASGESEEPIDGVPFPAIVKPAHEDASHGIGLESIVEDERSARARARYVLERYRQPALVEEFAPGVELGVSLLGAGEVLPMTELVFSGGLRLLTFASKWLPESPDYSSAIVVPHADDPTIAAVARAAWSAIGLRDYGRVDIRLSAAGDPLVIDVNPNPDISPDAGLAQAAARAGIVHAELVGRIVEGALARGRATATATS